MQRIFSTRLEEATIDELNRVTRRLGISKRQFLEDAIQALARHLRGASADDVWTATLGAWRRTEPGETTIRHARGAFQRSFRRHHRPTHARVRR